MAKTLDEILGELDTEVAEFHQALGNCILAWSSIEFALSRMLSLAFPPGAEDALYAAFFSVPSFHSKLNLTDSALSVTFNGHDVLTRWGTLKNKLIRKASVRNVRAHASAVQQADAQKGKRVFIIANGMNPASFPAVSGSPFVNYYQADLETAASRWRQIAITNIAHLQFELEGLTGRSPWPAKSP